MSKGEELQKILDELNKDLNPEQRKAAEKTEGPVMVIAGAGAGKTKTLIHRIATMVAKGIPPTSIVAVSFTRKAANELEDRLEAMVGENAQYIISGTFHTVVFEEILKKHPESRYLKSIDVDSTELTYMNEKDCEKVMRDIIKQLSEKDQKVMKDNDWKHSDVLSFMGLERAMGRDVQLFSDTIKPGEDHELFKLMVKECWSRYNIACRMMNQIDFDDVLLFADRMLTQEPHIAESLSRSFQYIMLDEYQDTNRVQMNIFDAIAINHNNICVVGDEKQSIYKFRGAEIGVILSFEQRYPKAMKVNMNRNYRSLPPIIKGANACAHNMEQKLTDGQLLAMRKPEGPGGGVLELRRYADQYAEARAIVSEVKADLAKGVNPNDIAVLYRNRSVKDILEQQLVANKIDYGIVGDKTIYESKAILDLVSLIAFTFQPGASGAGLRVIEATTMNLSSKKAKDMMTKNGTNLYAFLEEKSKEKLQAKRKGEDEPGLTEVAKKTGLFLNYISAIRESLKFGDEPKYIRECIAQLWDTYLKPSAIRNASRQAGKKLEKDGKPDKMVANKITENVKYILDRVQDELENGMEMGEILNDLVMMSNSKLRSSVDEKNKIQLMTMHASKGLEFPNVFVIGANNVVTPGDNPNLDDIEEERRLMYVAITRAMSKSVVSSADKYMAYGKSIKTVPSPFVVEISDTLGIPIKEFGINRDIENTSGF